MMESVGIWRLEDSPVLTCRPGVRYFGGFPEIRIGKEGVRISD